MQLVVMSHFVGLAAAAPLCRFRLQVQQNSDCDSFPERSICQWTLNYEKFSTRNMIAGPPHLCSPRKVSQLWAFCVVFVLHLAFRAMFLSSRKYTYYYPERFFKVSTLIKLNASRRRRRHGKRQCNEQQYTNMENMYIYHRNTKFTHKIIQQILLSSISLSLSLKSNQNIIMVAVFSILKFIYINPRFSRKNRIKMSLAIRDIVILRGEEIQPKCNTF